MSFVYRSTSFFNLILTLPKYIASIISQDGLDTGNFDIVNFFKYFKSSNSNLKSIFEQQKKSSTSMDFILLNIFNIICSLAYGIYLFHGKLQI